MSYCPMCGSKLFIIARGTFSGSGVDDRKIREIAEQLGERFRKALEEARKGYTTWRLDVSFVACAPCKRLFMSYGERGFYLDILGKLTNHAIALLVAEGIKGEK